MRRIPRMAGDGWQATAVVVAGGTGFIVLALLGIVLWISWLTGLPGDPDLRYTTANYARLVEDREILVVVGNTLGFCLLSLVVSLFFGLPAAWLVERTDLPAKRFVLTLMTVGLLVPGFASAMGWLLAIHLGFVLALFVTLPYGKMVHGVYRLLALVRHHQEQGPP